MSGHPLSRIAAVPAVKVIKSNLITLPSCHHSM